jgi:SAM-dependent methyltransferase
MDYLESLRQSLNFSDWQRYVKTDNTCRRWRYFLSSDPYTRWGLIKPKGYAGDATLMDFAYGHPSVCEDISSSGPMGMAVYSLTKSAKQSESARQRIGLIADTMERLVETRGFISVTSFASGHGRELELLEQSTRLKIKRFTAIDQDLLSLKELRDSSQNLIDNIQTVCENIMRCKPTAMESADLCYSLGLFDYLKTAQAEKVLKKMWRVVAPGGKLLVANLALNAANLGYCEAIMDWWMLARSEEEMIALGNSLMDTKEVEDMNVAKTGCFYYLIINKTPC